LAGGAVVGSIAAATYGVAEIGQGVMQILLPIGILSALGGLLCCLNASTLVTAKRITNNFWLSGVHPSFLSSLPEWPGEALADVTGFPDTSE
jgi:hypothetical protein